MKSIGPGRYNAFPAKISSIHSGLSSVIKFFMPPLSNWKTPSVLPALIMSNTSLSSNGMLRSVSSSIPAILAAFCMTVSVRRPRKSILSSPNSSNTVIVYCVVIVPSDALDNGTYSSTGLGLISTPAACIEVCLGSPSSRMDISIKFLACSSDS